MNLTAKRSTMIVFTFIICFMVLGLWLFSDLYFAREIAPFQETPDWTRWTERIPPGYDKYHLLSNDPQLPLDIRPTLLLRTAESGNRLLLKHRYGTVVYRYDSSNRTIFEASEDEWLKADGEIANCWVQHPVDHNRKVSHHSYPDYAAVLNGEKIDTYGRYCLYAIESPTRSKVALISAAGPAHGPGRISVIPFLGGSEPVVKGQKYVQIMDIDARSLIGEPVRVNGRGNNESYKLCWSADEQYVVFAQLQFENFSVIRTNKTGK